MFMYFISSILLASSSSISCCIGSAASTSLGDGGGDDLSLPPQPLPSLPPRFSEGVVIGLWKCGEPALLLELDDDGNDGGESGGAAAAIWIIGIGCCIGQVFSVIIVSMIIKHAWLNVA